MWKFETRQFGNNVHFKVTKVGTKGLFTYVGARHPDTGSLSRRVLDPRPRVVLFSCSEWEPENAKIKLFPPFHEILRNERKYLDFTN